ncbi:MAG: PKD domain-containing protein [Actinomycetota bacterium]|nr:PKD domain-containing protein [Actinomycetota bacterium]
MKKIIKSLKLITVFITVIAFCFTFIYIPSDNSLYAASTKIKVYIDAGHGGSDPGAIGSDLKEKDANLDIALKLKSKLEANGFEVVMTRTNDAYSTLDDRVNKANSSGADIFLSIHNNAALSKYAHGTETYWCANGVNGSSQFASLVQSNLVKQIGRANRGVKTADFRVIKYTKMPAALVECAFVSSPEEVELLKNANFREKCAVGLYNAIKEFSKGIKKSGGSSSESSSGNETGGSGSVTTSGREFSEFTVNVLEPVNNSVVNENFKIIGWSADIKNSPPIELKKVEFYRGPERNKSNLLGTNKSFQYNILGSTGIINGGWEETIEISMLNEGENIIYVYAYDKNDNYSTANVKVNVVKNGDTVPEVNHNPVANPGGPYTGKIGEVVTFDGSGSQDTDGSILEYTWDFGDGSIVTGSEVRPVHIYNEAGECAIKLKVKDNKGAYSAEVATSVSITNGEGQGGEDEEEPSESEFGQVSNSTNVTGYIELTADDLVRIFETRNSDKVEWARRIAPLYIKYGKIFDIRADIAWAQMCHETGFLKYKGDVKPDQNNFCGLGATGGGVPGNSFDTEELGIIAHYAHLAWYYYPNHINKYCTNQYDPRHSDTHLRYTGNKTLNHLNGNWAPGDNYTDKIINFANEIIQGINNTPPAKTVVASAGEDKTADAGKELTFDASKSTVSPLSDGVVITYSWDWNGDGTYDENVDKPVIKHTYNNAGTYTVTLKVTAFDSVTSTDTLTVTINEPNKAPTANPGGPYTATAGKGLTLDGSKSSDSDGTIKEYIWDFGDKSTAGSGVKPSHTYTNAGEYTVKLTVKDDKGAASAAVTTKVTVKEEIVEGEEENNGEEDETPEDGKEEDGTADKEDIIGENNQESSGGQGGNTGSGQNNNTPPAKTVVASAGEDKTADAGKELTFDASKSTVSPLSDGVVITYSWDWNGDGTYDENVDKPVIKHTYNNAGTYTVTLKVTAFDSVTSTDTLTVTINEPNKAPTANPGGPYTATAGKGLTLDGSKSSDSDGTIKEYIWDFGDGSKTGSGVKPVHTYTKAGDYTVKLTVKDDKGAASAAVTTKVTVEKAYPVNTSPITNKTNVVGYTEVTVEQLVKIFKNKSLSSDVIKRAERIAPLYIKYGKIFNIRADIAWAMMCHETGFLTYGGIVPANANNFCGLGATGGKDEKGNYLYNTFATEELGVIAQYAHLAWYYYPKHINDEYCSIKYDPRHSNSETHSMYGRDITLGYLNGRWAPGPKYTDKIIKFANQIYGF